MVVSSMSPGKELMCALAGPIGGLCLLLVAKWIPRTALCAALQSIYNFLPVYPLDGGRVLRCGAELLLRPDHADAVCEITESICIVGVVALGVYGTVILHLGLLPILAAGFLLWKTRIRKTPCKQAAKGLQ